MVVRFGSMFGEHFYRRCDRLLSVVAGPSRGTRIRRVCWATLGLAILLAVIGFRRISPFVNRIRLGHDTTWYDLGWYGLAPTKRYHSLDHPVVDVEFLQEDARCSQDYIIFAPRGPKTQPGGTILDHHGDLIWRQSGEDGDTQDLRVQEYGGEKFLTFWVGRANNGGKEGLWYMMDETYNIRHTIKPGGTHEVGDMHEFHLTADGTALISVYDTIRTDLSSIDGPVDGYLLDCKFQEINIETREVLFEWSAFSHFPLETSSSTFQRCSHRSTNAFNGCGDRPHSPFDFYHLNSIEKDVHGNYLVSGRNVFTLSYIDGKTGEVLWNLGGPLNDFEDLSGGQATNFEWQHDARLHENGTSISLFDNHVHKAWDEGKESRAMIIDINVANRTAKLRNHYNNAQQLLAFSQGNVQLQEDSGNVFVGWGSSAAFSEFAADGEVLCDARFGAGAFFVFAQVTSYRVFRDRWIGRPADPPTAVTANGKVYVSWNGATEVATWRVEGVVDDDWEEDDFYAVSETARTGFETEIKMPTGDESSLVRVVALDMDGAVLGVTQVIDRPSCGGMSPLTVLILTPLMILFGFVMALWIAFICIRSRCARKHLAARYQRIRGTVEDRSSLDTEDDVGLDGIPRPNWQS